MQNFSLTKAASKTSFAYSVTYNKMLYRALSRQVNRLILNIPVLQGLLRVNSNAEKHA